MTTPRSRRSPTGPTADCAMPSPCSNKLGAFAGGETATVETLDVAFGSSGREFARGIVEAALHRDAAGALALVETATDAGSDLVVVIRSLIAGFRHLLVAQLDLALLQRDLATEDAQRAAEQAADVAQSTLLDALRILRKRSPWRVPGVTRASNWRARCCALS